MWMRKERTKPIVAKTYGGTSWSSTQSKISISKAQKVKVKVKVKGILNVLGVYDHTNDQMYTHSI